jgi:ubiquinone/menaquinone biosynthesis C-methylase UbiE
VYAAEWLADGYTTSRPPVHSHILDRVASLGAVDPMALALDLGCGAGLSTIALQRRGIAHRVLGADPSQAMIRSARRHVEGASFVLAAAEALPVRSGSVGLLTAAGSLDYADIPAFFSESARVLSPDGLLVVYDFATGRRSPECAGLEAWYADLLRRWPKLNGGVQAVTSATFESARMRLVAYETFTVSLDFEVDGYVDYLMTESNVGAAIRAGVASAEIRSWCQEGLQQLFRGSMPIEFHSYYACLRQPD